MAVCLGVRPIVVLPSWVAGIFENLKVLPLCASSSARALEMKGVVDSLGVPKEGGRGGRELVIFVGGFFDSVYRVVFYSFCDFLKEGLGRGTGRLAFYATFNSLRLFEGWIPRLLAAGFRISFIAHSWGAAMAVKLCLRKPLDVENLITLDCVGRFRIDRRPSGIGSWENIYVADYFAAFHRSNLAALIGGAKGAIPFADSNIAMGAPANHASVSLMLDASLIFKSLRESMSG